MTPRYSEYLSDSGKNRYEVEHIWADKPERHTDEFKNVYEFREYRNRVGDLLLLPKPFNASFGALSYEGKLPHYYGQNILASSLNPRCYEHNPGFVRFVSESGLPFHAHEEFKKKDLDERGELYRHIAERVWNPDLLLQEVER